MSPYREPDALAFETVTDNLRDSVDGFLTSVGELGVLDELRSLLCGISVTVAWDAWDAFERTPRWRWLARWVRLRKLLTAMERATT